MLISKRAPQKLSTKDACIIIFSNFRIIGLCNYSAKSWFDIISILTVLPASLFQRLVEVLALDNFLSKHVWTIEARPQWYSSYFGFLANLNALSHYTFSEIVFLGKSLQSP